MYRLQPGPSRPAPRVPSTTRFRSEGRQDGSDHDRGDVLRVERAVAGVHAEPGEHADQRLLGEDRVPQPVARSLEADDEAVADEHVVAHAFEIGDVLDPRSEEHTSELQSLMRISYAVFCLKNK